MQTLKGVYYYKKGGEKQVNGYYVYVTKKQAEEANLQLGDPIVVNAQPGYLTVTKCNEK